MKETGAEAHKLLSKYSAVKPVILNSSPAEGTRHKNVTHLSAHCKNILQIFDGEFSIFFRILIDGIMKRGSTLQCGPVLSYSVDLRI